MQGMFNSIKFRMLILSLTVTVLLSAIVCFGIYQNMATNVAEEQRLSTGHNLKLVMDNVDQELFQIFRLVLWCSTDNDIIHFLNSSNQQYTTLPTAISAYNALRAQYFNSPVDAYINKLILCTYDGRYIIQGNSYGMDNDIDVCKSLPYFDQLLKSPAYTWVGIQPETFLSSRSGALSIPILRPVTRSDSSRKNGWIYFALNPGIIHDKIDYYMDNNENDIYLFLGDLCYKYTQDGFIKVEGGVPFREERAMAEKVTLAAAQVNGKEKTAVIAKSQRTNWYVMKIMAPGPSLLQVGSLKEVLWPLAVLAIVLLLFTLLLQRMVSRPVNKIYRRIKKIGSGDFSSDSAIEGADEFGFIGSGINHMAQDISKLMRDRMETEKAKRELELSLLQNQVNPHFLYNTLNTIKWMAVMQHAEGISEITSALAKMLKNISKNTDLLVPLKEELAFLNDYITIQSYRYAGMFSYTCNVDRDALLDCMIMRFSLQPIVENAIFHGIEPKKQFGRIVVDISGSADSLLISITDNGVGMSEEMIQSLLSSEENRTGVFKKIGLNNVNQRIKIEYGPEYGIAIASELGSYTCVTVRLPMLNVFTPGEENDTGGKGHV